MSSQFLIRLGVILIAIFTGLFLTIYVVKPKLSEKCLINTNQCLQIRAKVVDNSALINMVPSGSWIWFNGQKIYIYGEPSGAVCTPGFEPVYVMDPIKNTMDGYDCALPFNNVQNLYKDAKEIVIYVPQKTDGSTFSVFDTINTLVNKRIIKVN